MLPSAFDELGIGYSDIDGISGISSSTTTYIIAPAAKVSRYGMVGSNRLANSIVRSAPIGSTAPDNTPPAKALLLLFPSA